jgi:hypothetical protein
MDFAVILRLAYLPSGSIGLAPVPNDAQELNDPALEKRRGLMAD